MGLALREARAALGPSRTARLDAELLLAHVLKRERAWVIARHDAPISSDALDSFKGLVARRARGEPVAYLLGRALWYDLELEVSPAVLVPRPETELVLERACGLARDVAAGVVADIGTGSGALAIGLARCLPGAQIVAVDRSPGALQVARRNIERYDLRDRVTLFLGHLVGPLQDRPDMIVANLPYLSDGMMEELDEDVRYEPVAALHAGETGLELYAELRGMLSSRRWVVPLVLEIDPRQAHLVESLFMGDRVTIERDYAGHARVVTVLPGGLL